MIVDILSSWKNRWKGRLGLLTEKEQNTVISRLRICSVCKPYRRGGRCIKCGCPIKEKVFSNLKAVFGQGGCPIKKW